MESLRYQVTGMRCAGCAGTLETSARKFPGVRTAAVNFPGRLLKIERVEGEDFAPEAFRSSMQEIGFGLHPPREALPEASPSGGPLPLLALLGLPVLLHEHGLVGLPAATWLVPLLATLVLLLGAGEFLRGARDSLRGGTGNMDLLVSVGLVAAYGFSLATLLVPSLQSEAAHFGGVVMLLLFVRLGRSLEERVRARATTSLDHLAREEVGEATLIRWDESEDVIPADGLRVGDRIRVRAGERFPADGLVLEGESEVEEAFLTGEPLPRPKAAGDTVLASSVNGSGALEVEVTRVGAGTLYQKILGLAEDSLLGKPPIQRFADRVAAVFVPGVLLLGGLTLLTWGVVVGDWVRGLTAATSVVVVACPCALGLATPTAIMVASGVASELGILFRSGGALESLASIDHLVFDKTGTLTEGRFALQEIRAAPGQERSQEEILELARRLELASNHPLARAFREGDGPAPRPLPEAREIPGRGVTASLEGDPPRVLRLGSRRWMEEEGMDPTVLEDVSPEATQGVSLYLQIGEVLAGRFRLDDALRAETPEVLARLREKGYRTSLLSGDQPERVERFRATHDLEGAGGLLPEEKLAWIEERQAAGERLAFVGDGVNDAPALARADLGIALGQGAALARESGDLILLSGHLGSLVEALELSRRTLAKIRQNLFWAFGYNLLMLPLAAGAAFPWTGRLLPPHLAGLAMALSSISVVANSLLLKRGGGSRSRFLEETSREDG